MPRTAKKAANKNIAFLGTGRRKKSIARVRLVDGTGKITVNGKDLDEYFGVETLKVIVKQPLVASNTLDKYDVFLEHYLKLMENIDQYLKQMDS